jgi:hypothetical protein
MFLIRYTQPTMKPFALTSIEFEKDKGLTKLCNSNRNKTYLPPQVLESHKQIFFPCLGG